MTAPSEQAPEPGAGAAAPAQGHGPLGWLAELRALAAELPQLIGDRVDLFVLELQRASLALAQIVALIVVAAILGVTAWFALWAGVVVLLVQQAGWPVMGALGAAMVANLIAAWLAWQKIVGLAPLLRLPATRRHLHFNAGPRPEPAPLASAVTTEAPHARD